MSARRKAPNERAGAGPVAAQQWPIEVRNAYDDALGAVLGLEVPEKLEAWDRHQMTVGDLFMRYLSGCTHRTNLASAFSGVADDLRGLDATLHNFAGEDERIDPKNGTLHERIEGIAVRLEVLAEVHRRAVDRLTERVGGAS